MDIDEAILWVTFNETRIYVKTHWLKALNSTNYIWVEVNTTIKELRSFAYDILEIDKKFYTYFVKLENNGIVKYKRPGSIPINDIKFSNIIRAKTRMLHWDEFKHTFVLTYEVDGIEHSWVA